MTETRWRWLRASLLCALVLTSFGAFGCGGGGQTVWEKPASSEAEKAYRSAVVMMESGQFIEATKRFNELRLKFPFSSRWTTLAELRLADVLLEQGRYGPAAISYQEFIKSHPTHEDVGFARYQIGVCHYEQMPSDFFVLPDPWQRELQSAKNAEAALRLFLSRHPDSKYVEDARAKREEVRTRLARHLLYVAEFYLGRDAAVGATNRLLSLVHGYPDTAVADDGLFLLARSYILQKDVKAAAEALKRLVISYEDSDYVDDAREWLAANDLNDVEPMELGKQ